MNQNKKLKGKMFHESIYANQQKLNVSQDMASKCTRTNSLN